MPQRYVWITLFLVGTILAIIPVFTSYLPIATSKVNSRAATTTLINSITGLFSPLLQQHKSNHQPAVPQVNTTMSRTPVWFLSHGGPNIFEDTQRTSDVESIVQLHFLHPGQLHFSTHDSNAVVFIIT